MLAAIFFWSCVASILYSYVGYPLLLKLFSIGKKEHQVTFFIEDELPKVFIVLSCYNEEKVIREKMESVFQSTYPTDKLFVYVGLDASTDETLSILESFKSQSLSLTISNYKRREGKPNVINKLIFEISTTANTNDAILVLTDANVFFTESTIYELVKHFKDKQIGQVGANILNYTQRKAGIAHQERFYVQRENKIKYLEGLNWGTMVGAFGGCYAIRFDLFQTIPPNFVVDDFYLGMKILERNKHSILEPKAICYEDVSTEIKQEFNRKTRMSAGNFQNLQHFWRVLFRFDALWFCYVSHKVIRWKGPFLLLICFLCSCYLAIGSTFYMILFLLQLLLFTLPLVDKLLNAVNVHLKPIRFGAYFVLMNLALGFGFVKYIRGVKNAVWQPTKRE